MRPPTERRGRGPEQRRRRDGDRPPFRPFDERSSASHHSASERRPRSMAEKASLLQRKALAVDSVIERAAGGNRAITMSDRVAACVPTGAVVVLLLACAAGVLGCGRSGIDDFPPGVDGGGLDVASSDGATDAPEEGDASAPCDARTCPTGCCSAQGTCEPGEARSACGFAGQVCVDCGSLGYQYCDPSTTRVAAPLRAAKRSPAAGAAMGSSASPATRSLRAAPAASSAPSARRGRRARPPVLASRARPRSAAARRPAPAGAATRRAPAIRASSTQSAEDTGRRAPTVPSRRQRRRATRGRRRPGASASR
jgi:hypothetical protein